MSTSIATKDFVAALCGLLNETFNNVQGYFLDRGISLFETPATVSAEEASISIGGKCATLAAQVKHIAFYLDVLEKTVRTQRFGEVDWDKIWRETGAVTPAEWGAIQSELGAGYNRIQDLIADTAEWG
ncbi:MAG: hypothetical protein NZ553_00690 [Caldilinea sp.]|nr:hypothetical protein [Caldilinea sp.]MDW8438964.1 hypothetical protein [Caldilineaceae bacterium]